MTRAPRWCRFHHDVRRHHVLFQVVQERVARLDPATTAAPRPSVASRPPGAASDRSRSASPRARTTLRAPAAPTPPNTSAHTHDNDAAAPAPSLARSRTTAAAGSSPTCTSRSPHSADTVATPTPSARPATTVLGEMLVPALRCSWTLNPWGGVVTSLWSQSPSLLSLPTSLFTNRVQNRVDLTQPRTDA